MAEWQSGYAAACKAVYVGSIPASASLNCFIFAQVAKLVDARDLKSLGALNSMPVQVRPWVPDFALIFLDWLDGCFAVATRLGKNAHNYLLASFLSSSSFSCFSTSLISNSLIVCVFSSSLSLLVIINYGSINYGSVY